MSVTEIENYRELILENIEYDCLKRRYPLYRDDLNEIVELLVETVCAKRKTTRISGADFPHEIVRSRFLKLDSSHIEFVMDCLQKNTTQVRNMKQYLLAVLFNAPIILGLNQAVVAAGKLVLQHTGVLGADAVKFVSAGRDRNAPCKGFLRSREVHKGKLELHGAVKVVQKIAPRFKDGGLVLIL